MKSQLKDKIEAELLRIQEADPQGLLRVEAVVKFAEDPATALHSKFPWDDAVAAHQRRLDIARGVIRCYAVVVTPQKPERFRAFVSLTSDRTRGGGYRSLANVLKDDEQRALLLADAFRAMRGWMSKYGQLQELAGVFEEVRKVLPPDGKEAVAG